MYLKQSKSELMKDGGCHQKASSLKTPLVSNTLKYGLMIKKIMLMYDCALFGHSQSYGQSVSCSATEIQ